MPVQQDTEKPEAVVSCSSSVTAIFRKEVKVLDKDIAVQLAVFVLDMRGTCLGLVLTAPKGHGFCLWK